MGVLKRNSSKTSQKLVKIEEKWEPDVSIPPIISENLDEGDDGEGSASQTRGIVAELCKQRAIPSDLELQLQEYFKDHPKMKPLPSLESTTVDIDLADSEEETWIIQVPAVIDVEAELLAKKINLAAPRAAIKNCSVPLESHVQINSKERVIGLLAGSRVKSFVPTGFVRINQALPVLDMPDVASETNNPNHITVPYPEEIRERHPLLGYDFKEQMMLPKRVRKQLSLAQQKAALMYQSVSISPKKKTKTVKNTMVNIGPTTSEKRTVASTPVQREPVAKSSSVAKKRKRPLESAEEQEVVPMVTVKQEPLSPKRKKSNNDDEDFIAQSASVKKEISVEDDISWLLNI